VAGARANLAHSHRGFPSRSHDQIVIGLKRSVAKASVAAAIAKVATAEIAALTGSKLHELGVTRSTLAQYNLDRPWRNARTHTLHDPVRWKYFHIGNYALNGINPPRHARN
jgi:alkylation response protein AidB-like acyl-CoA dehydrogenase